jgi:hypothetical protein
MLQASPIQMYLSVDHKMHVTYRYNSTQGFCSEFRIHKCEKFPSNPSSSDLSMIDSLGKNVLPAYS